MNCANCGTLIPDTEHLTEADKDFLGYMFCSAKCAGMEEFETEINRVNTP